MVPLFEQLLLHHFDIFCLNLNEGLLAGKLAGAPTLFKAD